jgi:hydroxymethylpyrimidine pyrophosphatase-like HAD family hydrolase
LKFGILAIDYDGTIARDGVLDGDVRAAIEEVRTSGIVVVLVTFSPPLVVGHRRLRWRDG